MPPVVADNERLVQSFPLDFRAEVVPSSVNDDDRTIEVTFTTGAGVERYDWMSGKRYIEKLSLDPAAVRLARLNAGAPLLDTHSAWSVRDMLGSVVPGSASIKNKTDARATVQFSLRDEVDGVWQDVKTGRIRNVSVGYRVYAFDEVTPKGNALPVRTATDWEPYEISMVPMPADTGAQTRDGKSPLEPNPCRIVVRAVDAHPAQETPMKPENEKPDAIDESRAAEAARAEEAERQRAAAAAKKSDEPTDAELATRAERDRVQGITSACRAVKMTQAFADTLVRDGISLVEAQTKIFEEVRKRGGDDQPSSSAVSVRMGDDPMLHSRAGIENAILHRVSPTMFKLSEQGREFRAMSLIGIAETMLKGRGIRTTSMSKQDIASVALGLNQRTGYHTTSDFADLIEGIVNKTLRSAYDEAPATYKLIGRQISAPDFKNINLLQFGEAPALLEVKQHGEYTRGTIGTGKETFALKKYGRIFAITREAIVNDDLNAFSQVPLAFGRSARTLESDLVWAQITSNPVMGDGNALFSAAHNNLETDGDVISIASLSRARASIRLQTGLDGVTRLNLTPKYLLVPPSLETVAQQYVGQITPQSAANANPFSGSLTPVAEPRLEDVSAIAWYMATSPDQGDVVVYAFLDGQDGPVIEQRVGFDVDGIEIKARHEFAAKVVDWRGLHKDPGEAVS